MRQTGLAFTVLVKARKNNNMNKSCEFCFAVLVEFSLVLAYYNSLTNINDESPS